MNFIHISVCVCVCVCVYVCFINRLILFFGSLVHKTKQFNFWLQNLPGISMKV